MEEQVIEVKNKPDRWASRVCLINARTRLLCKTHGRLEVVTDFRPLAKQAVLSCGCTRKVAA